MLTRDLFVVANLFVRLDSKVPARTRSF